MGLSFGYRMARLQKSKDRYSLFLPREVIDELQWQKRDFVHVLPGEDEIILRRPKKRRGWF
jgi:antitoxin component of MazEF toxin-antitoxin module